jgi:hypothetical protein
MSSFDLLKTWIIENGGYVHPHLALNQTDSNDRYIYAKHPIPKNEKIFEIKDCCCLSTISDDPIFEQPEFESIKKELVVIKKFIQEKAKKELSFYHPYFQSLPNLTSFYDHPLFIAFYNPSVIEQWKKINLLVSILEIKCILLQNILLFFHRYFPNDQEKDIVYAYFIFITRAWDHGLVPFADLFQHSNYSDMFLDFTKFGTSFSGILITKSGFNENEIIFENYGIYDESILLFNFGFIQQENEKLKGT